MTHFQNKIPYWKIIVLSMMSFFWFFFQMHCKIQDGYMKREILKCFLSHTILQLSPQQNISPLFKTWHSGHISFKYKFLYSYYKIIQSEDCIFLKQNTAFKLDNFGVQIGICTPKFYSHKVRPKVTRLF